MRLIYDLHKTMVQNKLILIYEGEFTQEITKSVLAMAERNMDTLGEDSSLKRKVFNVMVECLQNIVKHSEPVQGEPTSIPVFIIGKAEGGYIVTTGNPILNEDIDKVQGKLDKINGLDKDGLKKIYKDIIKTTTISEKGGAGLGFVDIARKSGNNLQYDFSPLNGSHSYFLLKTIITK